MPRKPGVQRNDQIGHFDDMPTPRQLGSVPCTAVVKPHALSKFAFLQNSHGQHRAVRCLGFIAHLLQIEDTLLRIPFSR
jgi:hypothetical protein